MESRAESGDWGLGGLGIGGIGGYQLSTVECGGSVSVEFGARSVEFGEFGV